MKLAVVYEPTFAGFMAYAPDLPGCIAKGSTLEETRVRMTEAMALHLDGLRKDGLEVPEPPSLAEMVEIG
jgi:predicted RNase H-like HicB family nuclease